jgi:hypothetical protein
MSRKDAAETVGWIALAVVIALGVVVSRHDRARKNAPAIRLGLGVPASAPEAVRLNQLHPRLKELGERMVRLADRKDSR